MRPETKLALMIEAHSAFMELRDNKIRNEAIEGYLMHSFNMMMPNAQEFNGMYLSAIFDPDMFNMDKNQSLCYQIGGDTDEGWHTSGIVFDWHSWKELTITYFSRGSDCDGGYGHATEFQCYLDEHGRIEVYDQSSENYDQYAEMAGY